MPDLGMMAAMEGTRRAGKRRRQSVLTTSTSSRGTASLNVGTVR